MPKETTQPALKHSGTIRNVYLYLVSMIGLVVFILGSVGMIDNVLRNYVFQVDESIYSQPIPYPGSTMGCAQSYPDITDPSGKKLISPTADQIEFCLTKEREQAVQNRRNNIGREFSISIAQLLIGLPIWLLHWGIIQKDARRKKNES